MSEQLDGHEFRIISFTEGNPPVGVNLFLIVTQDVYVGAPVNNWRFKRVGENRYRLSVGTYPYVKVSDGKVIASIIPVEETEWTITRREFQNAFTIALADKPHLGWTVQDDDEHPKIVIGPLISTRSLPPQFLPKQLFLLSQED